MNSVFGEPESAKSFLAEAAVTVVLGGGGKALIVDLDHNGVQATVNRLLQLGVGEEVLGDLDRFRYVEPEDKAHLELVVVDAVGWAPDVAVVDSTGELLPLLRLNSNSPDDFTVAHATVLKPLAAAGAAVIAIDHLPKNTENKAHGPTGTAAKRRAIGGVAIRVTVKDPFTPGKGGSAILTLNKDRHGGLRRHCTLEGREPTIGVFRLTADMGFEIRAPLVGDGADALGVSAEDLAQLDVLDPPPVSVRDVKDRLGWGSTRATNTLSVWRSRVPTPRGEERGTRSVPVPGLFPRNEEQ
ncbi:MAG: hypothetical protein AB7L84_14355 [Acidimicrobiia bacterium]